MPQHDWVLGTDRNTEALARILSASSELVSRKGFDAFTVEAVAAELGVGVVSSLEVGNDPRVRAVPLVGPELTNRHLIGCLEKRRGLRVIRAFLELAAA